MTTINFYILSAQKKLMPFVCQLAQTVLQKSENGLLIIAPSTLLEPLDEKLWSFENTAFVPHQVIKAEQAAITDIANDTTATNIPFNALQAILTDQLALAEGFTGLVMNLTPDPLTALIEKNSVSKLFEIIAHDELSVIQGRPKFRTYRAMPTSPVIQTFHIN